MYIRLITLATFVQPLYGITNVLKCPFGERGWKIRQREFKCQEGRTYHCLLDLNGRPVEACLQRKEYQKDPACLVAVEERQNFSIPELTYHQDSNSIGSSSTSENPYEICQREITIYKILLVVLIIILVVIVVLFIIFILRRRIDMNETHTGSRNNEQRRFAWDLRETIRKGDNPDKVRDIYMSLAHIGNHNYMKILPQLGDTAVSFLIYAAHKNRKRTVLYFLQSYLDGSHVFTPDTYGVDSKNENIMHLAIRQGWTDVVEKLLEIDDNYFNNKTAIKLAKKLGRKFIVETLTSDKMA